MKNYKKKYYQYDAYLNDEEVSMVREDDLPLRNRCLYCYDWLDNNQSDFHQACNKFFFGQLETPLLGYNKNDVEIVITGGEDGRAKIGAIQTRSVDIITDSQTRVSVEYNGDFTVGHETNHDTVSRIYGKVGVNVKTPKEDLEVAGNIKFANKLMATADSIPTSGYYTKGDMVWNTNPKSNDYIGWICITSGNPGEWKPFGLIAS